MKLLVDHNISPRVVSEIQSDYPGSVHVRDVGLATAPDGTVWDYAKARGFVILSKDADFHQRSLVFGHPPKVVWIRRGNCSTDTIVEILGQYRSQIGMFVSDEASSFLTLG
jgi:predicted nuclease of predicted toxin-antitoxin system